MFLGAPRYCDGPRFAFQVNSYIDSNHQSVPFLLEDKIKELEGIYEKGKDWEVRIKSIISGHGRLTSIV